MYVTNILTIVTKDNELRPILNRLENISVNIEKVQEIENLSVKNDQTIARKDNQLALMLNSVDSISLNNDKVEEVENILVTNDMTIAIKNNKLGPILNFVKIYRSILQKCKKSIIYRSLMIKPLYEKIKNWRFCWMVSKLYRSILITNWDLTTFVQN